MKKFLSVMLALAMVVSCVSVIAFAADTKTVVNGNAEKNDLTGWETSFMGGTTENVAGGANGTAHAIKYTATDTYQSVGFDITAKVIQDEANGYNGYGAGEYTVSFYAKTEEDDVKFTVGFDNAPKRDNTYSWKQSNSPITVSDEWEQFELTINVTDEIYDVYKTQYDAGNKVILRLDGSKDDKFKDKETVVYYIDEVVVTGPDEETGDAGSDEGTTANPTPEVKTPSGVKITYNETENAAHYIISAKGVFTSADVKEGELTKTYSVKNNGDETLKVKMEFQLLHTKEEGGQTWAGPVTGSFVEIEPGETEEVTYTAEVEDGKVTVGDKEYDIADLFVRFDFGSGGSVELAEGTSATIYCGQTVAEAFMKGQRSLTSTSTLELVYGKVEGSGDALPVAFIALTVVASVALIVVSKKRREEF